MTTTDQICALIADLPGERGVVSASASLTGDLGMDSLDIEALIAGIREHIADITFTQWYVTTSRTGDDTIGSLAAYIDTKSDRTTGAS